MTAAPPLSRQPNAGVALVTGAAGRIGASIARGLAARGYRTVIHFRSSETQAKATAADIARAGGTVALVQADLSRRSERSSLIKQASEPFGPLSVLVNNASLFEPDSVFDVDEALWDQHFRVHAEAPVFLARDFAAQLPEGAEGNIVNIIDERVLHLSPANLSYTLSKAVLWTATRTLAQSLAPRIRVNAIGPGPTLPAAAQTQESFETAQARLPLKRGATPEDIADGVLFILGAHSMTGQLLALDGGEHLEYPERRKPTPRRP
ncbi:MAG: SDR family oxidoreductase [Devosia sp.]|nr:SDR family oxidoreductase [Devosia sp.]